uniref:Neurotransmitter-gated ion-channel ligand-binding domain-containing protein n=1 Tax=Panagrolaimus sp. JU765 TaxID=591449 RepID=A0AC34RR07_9BILA
MTSALQFQNQVKSDQVALFEHLFSTYRKELRPVKNQDDGPTIVTVQFYFKQIQKVQESDQILTVYCWLEEYWKDEFLIWNPEEFNGIRQLHIPSDMIWQPDLLV